MQRLFSHQCLHSLSISFPFLSLPSSQEGSDLDWLPELDFDLAVEEEDEEPWSEDLELPELELEPEFLLKDKLLLSLPLEPELVPDFGPEDWADPDVQDFSACQDQYQLSIEWARSQIIYIPQGSSQEYTGTNS
ncbi:hypothetical protein Moror_14395 [Moniliophthora roreri MCA 2997]|uniref:Uncharacterized protein n=1 Tax=Moniliophthora roreri (strain MCA 2997) TaxID=1381753 RepID=V2XSV0_MONRO|nr:hypothetical protein Moror_14395 [Moniliophthora roreri MCA 2997]